MPQTPTQIQKKTDMVPEFLEQGLGRKMLSMFRNKKTGSVTEELGKLGGPAMQALKTKTKRLYFK